MKKQNGTSGATETLDLANIFKRGLLLFFRADRWAAFSKMKNDSLVEDEDEKRIIRAVQSLITPEDRELLSDIKKDIGKCKKFIFRRTLPFPMESFTFVRKEQIVEINDFLLEQQKALGEKVEEFLEKYDKVKADFKKRYPKLYRADKYPTKERLRERFYIYWSFHRLEVPESGTDGLVTPDIYKQEIERAKQTVDEMTKLATTTIANAFVRRIDSLREQAVNGEINMRTVNSILKVMSRFDEIFKGFVNEKAISETIKEVKQYLVKEDPEAMREDSKWVEKLGKSMASVVKKLETLPDVKAKRRIKIEE